jgi:hypothetical protein
MVSNVVHAAHTSMPISSSPQVQIHAKLQFLVSLFFDLTNLHAYPLQSKQRATLCDANEQTICPEFLKAFKT